jgi:CRP-like cAMP-binding protein
MASTRPVVQPLFNKLLNYGELSSDEKQSLEDAVSSVREVLPDHDLVAEGTTPDYSCLLLSGFAGRYNISVEGKRQITALHVAGDFVDLHSFLMKPMDHSIGAIGTCRIATVSHAALARITENHPRLTRLLWLNTLIDAGTHRRWEFILGSLQGHQHLAHLVCEMYLRLAQIGKADKDGSFHLPLTQMILSECLALSPVHTNRVIQKLRGENAISWERDLITIKNWDRLVETGEFDPTYLRMPKWVRPISA